MSRASDELSLYIVNDGKIHKTLTAPLQKRLAKAMADGTFDNAKALKSFESIANEGARAYGREGFEEPFTFTSADKRAVARDMLDYFKTEHRLNGLGSVSGSKSKADLDRDIAAALRK